MDFYLYLGNFSVTCGCG